MPRRPNADPTPEEIRERSREIQAEWNERTFKIRAGCPVDIVDQHGRWTAPEISMSEIQQAAFYSY